MSIYPSENPRVARARLLMERRRYDEATGEFRAALAEDPNDPVLHGLLSLCLSEQDKHAEAVDSAKNAVRCGPELDFSHYVLAHAQSAPRSTSESRWIAPSANCWMIFAPVINPGEGLSMAACCASPPSGIPRRLMAFHGISWHLMASVFPDCEQPGLW